MVKAFSLHSSTTSPTLTPKRPGPSLFSAVSSFQSHVEKHLYIHGYGKERMRNHNVLLQLCFTTTPGFTSSSTLSERRADPPRGGADDIETNSRCSLLGSASQRLCLPEGNSAKAQRESRGQCGLLTTTASKRSRGISAVARHSRRAGTGAQGSQGSLCL